MSLHSHRSLDFLLERRRGETSNPADISPGRKIIKEIEWVRIEMGWDGIDYVKPRFRVNNSTALNYGPKVNLPSPYSRIWDGNLTPSNLQLFNTKPRRRPSILMVNYWNYMDYVRR